MDIFLSVDEQACTTTLNAASKDECLHRLSELVARARPEVTVESIYAALAERELSISTGLEEGIAIPHARLDGIEDFLIGIAVAPHGVSFDSLDGKPSRIFFVLLGPENRPEEHLKIMAHIMRIARNKHAYRELLRAPSAGVLRETFLMYARSEETLPTEDKGALKLLLIFLYEDTYFEDIINLFLERGITGAAVFDVRGMRNILSGIPLFSDFIDFLKQRSDAGQGILTLIPETQIKPLVDELEQLMGDLDTHTGAMVLALDTLFAKGSLEVL